MDFTRAELKAQAKEQLKGKVWPIFGITLVAMLIIMGASGIVSAIFMNIAPAVGSILSSLVSIFVGFPISMGLVKMYLGITYGDDPKMSDIFRGFKENYGNTVLVCFLMELFILLWSCLFVIPGIIMTYAYSQAMYIAAEHPEMTPMECIKASKEMMKGRKWDLFVLELSFIGWILLVCITFGIAAIYVAPYMQLTSTNFYHRIKGTTLNVDKVDTVEEVKDAVADAASDIKDAVVESVSDVKETVSDAVDEIKE